MAYLVNQKLKLLGTGLEREPGQFVTDADFRTCPGLRDALLAEGAITQQANVQHRSEEVKHGSAVLAATAAMGTMAIAEQYDIPESPAEQRRRKREAK